MRRLHFSQQSQYLSSEAARAKGRKQQFLCTFMAGAGTLGTAAERVGQSTGATLNYVLGEEEVVSSTIKPRRTGKHLKTNNRYGTCTVR